MTNDYAQQIRDILHTLDRNGDDRGMVRVVHAIESGSRAWGFASPDSDYDCRFIYVRPLHVYASLNPPRDVIEFPCEGLLDINGWDLRKTLHLLLNGNAVVIEWFQSTIPYRQPNTWLRDEITQLFDTYVDKRRIVSHYYHLARRINHKYIKDFSEPIKLKKVFYVLRPALALRFLRLSGRGNMVPMNIDELVKRSSLCTSASREIAELLETKRAAREMGVGVVSPVIQELILDELGLAQDWLQATPPTPLNPAAWKEADTFLLAFSLAVTNSGGS